MNNKLIRMSLILAMTICLNACDKREEFSASINHLKEQPSKNSKEVDSHEKVKTTEPAVEPGRSLKLED